MNSRIRISATQPNAIRETCKTMEEWNTIKLKLQNCFEKFIHTNCNSNKNNNYMQLLALYISSWTI